jgi:hypothetical protein
VEVDSIGDGPFKELEREMLGAIGDNEIHVIGEGATLCGEEFVSHDDDDIYGT